MDIFCPFCDQANAATPVDHDCIGNLERLAEQIMRGIDESTDEGWDSLSCNDLLDTESKLAEVYGKMRGVTEFFSARIEEAGRERDKVYGKKQVVRAHLNAARTVIRARMSDID